MGDAWSGHPRRVNVLVDNDSWQLPFAEQLVANLCADGDTAALCRSHAEMQPAEVTFCLGCVRIAPPEVLALSRFNLVIHTSDLPKGRGWSPMTWQVLEGAARIPVTLLHAAESVDSGAVVYKEWFDLEGHELLDELHQKHGETAIALCQRYMREPHPLPGTPQTGEPSFYERRRPEDSQLDMHRPLAEQFNLLRVVDNERYPATLDWQGHRYKLTITKI